MAKNPNGVQSIKRKRPVNSRSFSIFLTLAVQRTMGQGLNQLPTTNPVIPDRTERRLENIQR
jgi:hypothetical protein